jgi:D-alanyl-lipoteichoic acid acyltransferase DltB (MBOAT superfamily)
VGRSESKWWKFTAVIIVFGLCGLWHGAAWNFVTWGLLFAVMYSKHIFFKRKTPRTSIVAEGKMLPSWTELRQMGFTFLAVTIPCIFFRAESFDQGMDFIWGFLSISMFEFPSIHPGKALTGLIVLFFMVEWIGRHHWSPLTYFQKHPFWVQWSVYQIVIGLTWYYRALEKTDFIYFQF